MSLKPSISSQSKPPSYEASQMFCFKAQCIQNKTFEKPCTSCGTRLWLNRNTGPYFGPWGFLENLNKFGINCLSWFMVNFYSYFFSDFLVIFWCFFWCFFFLIFWEILQTIFLDDFLTIFGDVLLIISFKIFKANI